MHEQERKKLLRMTTEPVHKLVFELAVPSIISMLVTGLYNMADTFFVGQAGTEATAAVGLCFPIMMLLQAFGFFFGQGSGTYISRSLGAGEHDQAQIMASTAVVCSLLFGALLLLGGLIFEKPLLLLLGASEELVSSLTVRYAWDYLLYILLAAPFVCTTYVLNTQLRFQGNASFAMVGMVSGALLNCLLDPLLIFGFHMQVRGAALATAISQTLSCGLLFAGTIRSDSLKIHLREFCPNAFYMKNIVIGGTPSLFRQGLASVATLCLNAAAGAAVGAAHADQSIAAFSIVSRLMFFALSTVIGFGQGFQPVCGFNYGAKRYDRVREGHLFCLKLGIIVMLIAGTCGFAFAEGLISLFRDDPQVIAIGKIALRCQCCTITLMVFTVISNMAYQSMGRVWAATILALARQGLTFLPAILILPRLLNNAMLGVYLAQPAADVLSLAIALPLTIRLLRELRQGEQERDREEQKILKGSL